MDPPSLLTWTLRTSLLVQLLTWSLQLRALGTVRHGSLLWGSIWIETIVQVIEALAYSVLLWISDAKSMMLGRYFDWLITTPSMLVSLSAYLVHLRGQHTTWSDFWQEHSPFLKTVFVTNLVMLLSGLGVRTGLLGYAFGMSVGWIAFFLTFGLLAWRFGSQPILGATFGVWAGYGIAEFLPDVWCNVLINLLDVVAKNVFGVLLSLEALNS
jgi:hypothetical protein